MNSDIEVLGRHSRCHSSAAYPVGDADWRDGDAPEAAAGSCIHGYPKGSCARCGRSRARDSSTGEAPANPPPRVARTTTSIPTDLVRYVLQQAPGLNKREIADALVRAGLRGFTLRELNGVLYSNPGFFRRSQIEGLGVPTWRISEADGKLRLSSKGRWTGAGVGRAPSQRK
jgi:hypothetical protein